MKVPWFFGSEMNSIKWEMNERWTWTLLEGFVSPKLSVVSILLQFLRLNTEIIEGYQFFGFKDDFQL